MFKKIAKLFQSQMTQKSKVGPVNDLPNDAQLYLAAIANLQNHSYPNVLELFNRIVASDNYGIDAEQDAGFHYNSQFSVLSLHS